MESDSSVEKSAYHSLHLKLCEQSALIVINIMVEFDSEAAKKNYFASKKYQEICSWKRKWLCHHEETRTSTLGEAIKEWKES